MCSRRRSSRSLEGRRGRSEFGSRFRQGHHSRTSSRTAKPSPITSPSPASGPPRRRSITGATSGRSTPTGPPTSTSPTSCPISISMTGRGRSGPTARSLRRPNSCTTSTGGAVLAAQSLLSGGCIVSGASISRSLVFTGVHRPFLFDDPRGHHAALRGNRAKCAAQQGGDRQRGAHSGRPRRRRGSRSSTRSGSGAPRTA